MAVRVSGQATRDLLLLVVCLLILLGFLLGVTVMIGFVIGHVANMVQPD